MKTHKHPQEPTHEEVTRHLSSQAKKSLELGAEAEHETGTRREQLLHEANRRAN